MKTSKAIRLIIAAVGAVLLHLTSQVTAEGGAAPCDPWVARIVSVQGSVEIRRAGQTQWTPARLNDLYCGGDQIQVGERSRADLALINQPILRLDQNTTISLGGIKEQRVSWLDLLRGALYFFSRSPRNLEVRTAFVNAGVEGTEGLISVDSKRTSITIFEGMVLAENPAGTLTLTGGQSALAEQGKPPALTAVVRPRDAVQWAIYYPPTLYLRAEDFRAGPGWEGAVRNSLGAYRKGDLRGAFDAIGNVPEAAGNERFFAYRASLLLAVGRFDEARKDTERALSLRPNYSDALALQSIVAVARNEKEIALKLAQQAVTADANSASALIALSYAQQANFDLDGALSSLQRAVQFHPENALAWARLAELWLSFGQLREALQAAQQAAALDASLSRTQTVLGFAFLAQVNTDQAKKAFERAIELDQADPLPRLGLGLAKIREGDLEEGRREIEIAVSLDPDNALVRSYLGKAYFEEKRDKRASDQYEMSKQLDPKDPTPYFYDAIRKQTTNRPVEALQDMQKAIELNDNRAVYRSRLLLDSDLAARSAALSRIYSDLGFQQLGLVEGWKSVNTDPTNFSAHRFLADSYSARSRHEIARVSELLQSQLLQPLNMTPVQPHLAESNLLLFASQGPAAVSFNEFNPLFNRDGLSFQSTGLAGENSTYGGEGILSGIYQRAGFSLGGFHFRTDGWRSNAAQEDSIGNGLIQLELTPQTSVQAEFRYRDRQQGDLQLNFFRPDFRRHFIESVEMQSYRLGLRHSLAPNSILLGSLIYQDRDSGQIDKPDPILIRLSDQFPKQQAFSGELQHLYRSKYINLTTGVGHFNINKSHSVTQNFDFTPFGGGMVTVRTRTDEDDKHTNMYLYSSLHVLRNLTLTVGLSGDIFKTQSNDTSSTNQINPKFGVTWHPVASTTVRAAVFRVLKRTLITDQTLEPTQVAGFNQFFDDINSTKSWRYGAAIDQKFTNTFFGGIEFSKRTLDIPFRSQVFDEFGNLISDSVERGDGREYLGRTYLFWTPHPWWALSAEYEGERYKNESPVAFFFKEVTTHRVPLALRFVHPSGLGLFFRTTYVNQNGKFIRRGASSFESGSDHFWLVDTGISYRFPKRYGIFSIGSTNLFNQHFKYQETDFRNARILPGRGVFAKLAFSLP